MFEQIKLTLKKHYGLTNFRFTWSATRLDMTLVRRELAGLSRLWSLSGLAIPKTANAYTADMLLGFTVEHDNETSLTSLKNFDEEGVLDASLVVGAGKASLGGNHLAALVKSLTANSTAATGSSEAVFSNGSYTIAADIPAVGTTLRCRACVRVTGKNGTDTQQFRVRLGATGLTGTVVADSTAKQYAANDLIVFDFDIVFRVVGASGKIMACGTVNDMLAATPAAKPISLTETSVDSTAALSLVITAVASSSNAGNTAVLENFTVLRAG